MPLTNFQVNALREVEKLFESIFHLECGNFEEVIGKKETYLKAMVKSPQHVIEVYLYENESGYLFEGEEWTIFEKPDYSSPNELLGAFLVSLRNKLS